MNKFLYTLLSDGSSDRALMPHISWLLNEHVTNRRIEGQWADPKMFPSGTKGLLSRIRAAIEIFPSDLLFVHRDAERDKHTVRVEEIGHAVVELGEVMNVPHVCVVPVRMTEAWLLFDSEALRIAADNLNGRMPLKMPALRTIEQLPDPKSILHDLLRCAYGKKGQRLKGFPASTQALRVSEFIEDFSPLRALPAFQALEAEIIQVIQSNNWNV